MPVCILLQVREAAPGLLLFLRRLRRIVVVDAMQGRMHVLERHDTPLPRAMAGQQAHTIATLTQVCGLIRQGQLSHTKTTIPKLPYHTARYVFQQIFPFTSMRLSAGRTTCLLFNVSSAPSYTDLPRAHSWHSTHGSHAYGTGVQHAVAFPASAVQSSSAHGAALCNCHLSPSIGPHMLFCAILGTSQVTCTVHSLSSNPLIRKPSTLQWLRGTSMLHAPPFPRRPGGKVQPTAVQVALPILARMDIGHEAAGKEGEQTPEEAEGHECLVYATLPLRAAGLSFDVQVSMVLTIMHESVSGCAQVSEHPWRHHMTWP